MNKLLLVVLICAILGVDHARSQSEFTDVIEAKEWVVVLDDPRPKRLQGWQRTGYRGGSNYRSAIELKRFGGRLAKDYKLTLKDQWLIESLGVYCLIVTFNDDTKKTISALEKLKNVQWVQPSNDFDLLSSTTDKVSKGEVESFQPVITTSMTGDGVTIAIIDSAVDRSHPDLAAAVASSTDFVIASKEKPKPRSVGGEAHGTAIAGVIVAQPDSKLGIVGIAPEATLLAYRGCWENERGQTKCNTLSLARSLDAVSRSGADILNLSLSGPKDFLLDQLVNRVITNGTLVVAAFDPQRAGLSRFPSEKEGVLIVRAETMDSQFDNVFTAPGALVVASPGNRYDFKQGHSIATAYTSGVIALVKQSQASELGSNTQWREFSDVSRATDLMLQLSDEAPEASRALLTNQYLVLSD